MQDSAYPPVVNLADFRARRPGPAGPRPLTKKELAAELGCSVRTIERWQQDPTFPVERYYDGAMVRYRLASAQAWLQTRTLPSAPHERGARPGAKPRSGRTSSREARRDRRPGRL